MNPHQFADKWRRSTIKESAGYVPHFEDVCRLVDHPTPTDADPSRFWHRPAAPSRRSPPS